MCRSRRQWPARASGAAASLEFLGLLICRRRSRLAAPPPALAALQGLCPSTRAGWRARTAAGTLVSRCAAEDNTFPDLSRRWRGWKLQASNFYNVSRARAQSLYRPPGDRGAVVNLYWEKLQLRTPLNAGIKSKCRIRLGGSLRLNER